METVDRFSTFVRAADPALANPRPAFDTGTEMANHFLIADDHPLMRSALRQAVAQAFPGAEILEAARYDQLQAHLVGATPDLVLLDLHMPGMSGFIGLMMLRSEHPEIPVIVVSAAEDPATIQRSMDYGASGFVPKSAPLGQVADAIRHVLAGEVWLPETTTTASGAENAMAERAVNLTPQQLRVLVGMAEGKLNKQIAYDMAISEQTVKDHVTVILRKLGATNRTQAILVASQLALRPPPRPE